MSAVPDGARPRPEDDAFAVRVGSRQRFRMGLRPQFAGVTILALTGSMCIGGLVPVSVAYGLAIVGLLIALVAHSIWGPIGLVALAILASWLGRGAGALGLGTTAIGYADFALIVLGVLLSVGVAKRSRQLDKMTMIMVAFGCVIGMSAVANSVPPLRAFAACLLLLEPFLMLIILLQVDHPGSRRILTNSLVVILIVQVPVAVIQWSLTGPGDGVQGTLVGAGAGAHRTRQRHAYRDLVGCDQFFTPHNHHCYLVHWIGRHLDCGCQADLGCLAVGTGGRVFEA